MSDDTDNEFADAPMRPNRPAGSADTHTAFQFRRIGKKWGVYKVCGVGRVPPCPHCGEPYRGKLKVFVDMLAAFGGGQGGFMLIPKGEAAPKIKKDYPEQAEFDDREIFPES